MSKCKRCGAEIIWITTVAGKNMPCDAEPVALNDSMRADMKLPPMLEG